MTKLKQFTIKRNQTIYKTLDDKELFLIAKGCNDFEQYEKLKALIDSLDVSYKYLGVKNGFHEYKITVLRGFSHIIELKYTGNTDHSDNALTMHDIFYEIAEIACSDPTNPQWNKDKKRIEKVRKMFTDDEISFLPLEIID